MTEENTTKYEDYSIDELENMHGHLAEVIARKKELKIQEAIDFAKAAAEEVGFTLRQLADHDQMLHEQNKKRSRKKKVSTANSPSLS